MSIEVKAGKDHLKGTALTYPDGFFSLRGERVVPENTFSFYTYDALNGVKDYATNNLSNLFLTRRALNGTALKTTTLNPSRSVTTVKTGLQTGRGTMGEVTVRKYLWNVLFAERTTKYGGPAEYADIVLGQGEPGEDGVFHVSFLSGTKCTVSHTSSAGTYYLDRLDLAVWELYRTLWVDGDTKWSQAENLETGALCWRLDSGRQWDYTLEMLEDDPGKAELSLSEGALVVGIDTSSGLPTLSL